MLFQSVTFRTAGFAAVSQVALRPVTAFFGVLLMMIGGSPVGTAGGMKTVTIAVIFYTFAAMIRNHEDTEVFKRSIPVSVVKSSCNCILKYEYNIYYDDIIAGYK